MDIPTTVCVVVGVIGLLSTVLLWLRGRRGRALQVLGLALLPLALLLVGLLRLVIDGVMAVIDWATRLVLSPVVWAGIGVAALAVVLWVVGGILARRTPAPRPVEGRGTPEVIGASTPKAAKKSAPQQAAPKKGTPADDDMDEIEAILRSRGIE